MGKLAKSPRRPGGSFSSSILYEASAVRRLIKCKCNHCFKPAFPKTKCFEILAVFSDLSNDVREDIKWSNRIHDAWFHFEKSKFTCLMFRDFVRVLAGPDNSV